MNDGLKTHAQMAIRTEEEVEARAREVGDIATEQFLHDPDCVLEDCCCIYAEPSIASTDR